MLSQQCYCQSIVFPNYKNTVDFGIYCTSSSIGSQPFGFVIPGNNVPADYRTGLIYEWYADSNVTSSLGKISAWKNTIDTLTARQSTAGNKPTLVTNQLNGRSVIQFDTLKFMSMFNITVTNYTIMIIYKSNGFDGVENCILGGAVIGIYSAAKYQNGGYGEVDATHSRDVTFSSLDLSWNIRSFLNTQLFSNGVEPSYAHSQNITGETLNLIGKRSDGYFSKVSIACIRIYNANLASANRKTAEDFLNYLYKIY